jgi:electron transport complex protein RnfG
MNEQGPGKLIRSAAALGLVALIGTTLLAGVDRLTAERIAAQERRVVLERLAQIVPPEHDNDLLADRITFTDERYFPNRQQVVAYRARRGTEPLAVVLEFAAVDGYNGNIRLLVGVDFGGRLRGVRVVSHKETPGLGDAIELGKSDWILAFAGKSLDNPEPAGWAVRADGGDFDQFTGATITPRAVVDAVQGALEFFGSHRDDLFRQAEAQPEEGESGQR